jgi:hypothetical protein
MIMSIRTSRDRVAGSLRSLQLSWATVVLTAALASLVSIFVMITLGGAVGAVERLTPPFERWLRDSILIFPLFVVAVVGAFFVSAKLVGDKKGWVKTATTLVMIMLFITVLGIAVNATSSAYDYYLQVKMMNTAEHLRHPTYLIQDGTPVLVGGKGTCNLTCQAKNATLTGHFRGLGFTSIVLLISNAALVLWAVAIRGGRLWMPATRRRAVSADTQMVPTMAEALA